MQKVAGDSGVSSFCQRHADHSGLWTSNDPNALSCLVYAAFPKPTFSKRSDLLPSGKPEEHKCCNCVRLQRPCGYKAKPFGANTAIGLHSWKSSRIPWSNGTASPWASRATQSHTVCIYTHTASLTELAEITQAAEEDDAR